LKSEEYTETSASVQSSIARYRSPGFSR